MNKIVVSQGQTIADAMVALMEQLAQEQGQHTIVTLQVIPEIIPSNAGIVQPGQPAQGSLIYKVISVLYSKDEDDATDELKEAMELIGGMGKFKTMFAEAMQSYHANITAIMGNFTKAVDELRETVLHVNQDKGGQ